jgi:hypothetical protein
MTCDFCGDDTATVRNRPRYGEEPIALCQDCWLDLQEITTPRRQEP